MKRTPSAPAFALSKATEPGNSILRANDEPGRPWFICQGERRIFRFDGQELLKSGLIKPDSQAGGGFILSKLGLELGTHLRKYWAGDFGRLWEFDTSNAHPLIRTKAPAPAPYPAPKEGCPILFNPDSGAVE